MSAVNTKQAETFQVECIVLIFDNCTQNSLAVSSIIEHLLKPTKKESHQIENAYHSGSLLLSLPFISPRTSIKVPRYDFSELHSGRDMCDRKTAPVKAHIRRWVNQKDDVITAEDMNCMDG